MSAFRQWSPDDSAELDAAIRRRRKRSGAKPVLTGEEQRKIMGYPVADTVNPTRMGMNDQALRAKRRMQEQARQQPAPARAPSSSSSSPPRRLAQPKQLPDGCWVMRVKSPAKRKRVSQKFDTEQEALRWRDEVMKGGQ